MTVYHPKYQQITMVGIGVEKNSEKDRLSENYYEVHSVIAGISIPIMQAWQAVNRWQLYLTVLTN